MGKSTKRPQPEKHTIKVLIVDDHPLFRQGLERALELEDDIAVIGHCEDGQEALDATQQLQPDVMLLDINLPTMNGLQVARQLKNKNHEVAIIMLTAYHDEEQVLHTMRAGAAAYCAKDVTPEQLVNIIRAAAAGLYIIDDQQMSSQEVETWISEHIEAIAGPYMIDAEEHFIPLSPREMEILQYVTHGMSNKEIAHRLGISQQTVKNHMTSILRKLNVEDRTQAAVTALRRGWVRMHDIDN